MVNLPENYHEIHLEGTMQGWYQKSDLGAEAKGAHWITFLVLFCCTLFLCRDSWKAKGPSGKERFYAGYHEEYNISLFVNLFATIAYFGKIVADSLDHNYSNVGPLIIGLGNYRYADYMLTCPLLAYDLLSQVRAPYKVTGAVLIFSVLLTGAATNYYPGKEMQAGAVAWFCCGCVLYTGAYYLFFTVVRAQYERLLAMAHQTDAKKAFLPLRLAVYTFFTIWIVFPLVWLLGHQGLNYLTNEVQEVLHCVCDIVAKSFYAFALARYRSYFDKKLFAVLEELGLDGEEELEHLEKDLKEMDHVDHMSSTLGYAARRHSREFKRRCSEEFSPIPTATRMQQDILVTHSPKKRQIVFPPSNQASPRIAPASHGRYQSNRPPHGTLSVDQLKAQLELINQQIRAVELEGTASDYLAVPPNWRGDRRGSGIGKNLGKMRSPMPPLAAPMMKVLGREDDSSDEGLQVEYDRGGDKLPTPSGRPRRTESGYSPGQGPSSSRDDEDTGRGLC